MLENTLPFLAWRKIALPRMAGSRSTIALEVSENTVAFRKLVSRTKTWQVIGFLLLLCVLAYACLESEVI